MVFFFFCKHKTAYEMRISDWSSDVCSSDLPLAGVRTGEPAQLGEFKRGQIDLQLGDLALEEGVVDQRPVAVEFGARDRLDALDAALRRGDPGDRQSVV